MSDVARRFDTLFDSLLRMTDEERQQWVDWLRTAPPIGTIVEVIRNGAPTEAHDRSDHA